MLRSLENLEFIKSHANSLEIQMCPQGEMIEMALDLQAFQLEESVKRSKNMIVLSNHSTNRCFAQSSILFERLVEDFYRPSFLIGRQNQSAGHRCVTAGQIEHSRAAVFICKDLAHEQYRKWHVFEPACKARLFLPGQFFNRSEAIGLIIFFTPLRAPLTQLRLGLMSSSGHFVDGDDPKPFGVENMSQKEAEARIDEFLKVEPQLSVIPMDTPIEKLRVRHGGYDVRDSLADPNVNFPISRLRELQKEGWIGELALDAYSFMGATSQLRLLNHTGPEWVKIFQEKRIDALLLVPV